MKHKAGDLMLSSCSKSLSDEAAGSLIYAKRDILEKKHKKYLV